MNLDNPISTVPRKMEKIATRMIMTTVDPVVCFREGHVTFLSSIITSLRNCTAISGYRLSLLPGLDAVRAAALFLEGIDRFLGSLDEDAATAVRLPEASPSGDDADDLPAGLFFLLSTGLFFFCKRPIILLKW